jgi:hypothetical protein
LEIKGPENRERRRLIKQKKDGSFLKRKAYNDFNIIILGVGEEEGGGVGKEWKNRNRI